MPAFWIKSASCLQNTGNEGNRANNNKPKKVLTGRDEGCESLNNIGIGKSTYKLILRYLWGSLRHFYGRSHLIFKKQNK